MTEDRGQMTEDRGQMSEGRCQRSEVRGQISEDRGQKTNDRITKSESFNRLLNLHFLEYDLPVNLGLLAFKPPSFLACNCRLPSTIYFIPITSASPLSSL